MLLSLSGSLGDQPSELPPSVPLPPSGDDDQSPASVVHDAAARFLDIQISTGDFLDTRNANIFSISSVVLPVTFGLLTLGDREIPGKAEMALVGALICYVLVLVFAWVASISRGLEYRPYLPTLHDHSKNLPGNTLRAWVAEEYIESTEANRASLVRKARLVGQQIPSFSLREFFCLWRRYGRYCDPTFFGAGKGFGVRTMMLDGPEGGSLLPPNLLYEPERCSLSESAFADWLGRFVTQ